MEPQSSYVRVRRVNKMSSNNQMMFVMFTPGIDSGLTLRQKVAAFFQLDFHSTILFSVGYADLDRTELRKRLVADQVVLTAQNTDESSLWYLCSSDEFESIELKNL